LEALHGLVLLLALAKLLEYPLRRARLNPIVAHVAAGLVLGPYILGLVEPLPVLEEVSYLGLLLFMFYTGMTTSFRELQRMRKAIVFIGAVGAGFTALLTYLSLKFLGLPNYKSLIISVIMSNTATETVAAIVRSEHDEVTRTIVLGSSVVDDILAVFMISIVTQGINELSKLVEVSLLTCLLLVTAIGLSSILVRHPSIFYRRISGDPVVFASISILLAMSLAYLSKLAGLSELIGAYIAGLIIGRGREYHDPLLLARVAIADFIDDLKVFLESFFIPIFFTYVGLLTTPYATDTTLFAVLLTTAVIGKVIGCGFASYAYLRNGQQSTAVGVAMVGRGALETALLKLLLDQGLLTVGEYSSILAASLCTTVLAPILYTFIRRS